MSWTLLDELPTADTTDNGVNSTAFKNNIASLKSVILNSGYTDTLEMTKIESLQWTGDLGGWLIRNGYDEKYHFTIAWVNGFSDPTEYDGSILQLIVPQTSYLDGLVQNFTTEVTG